MCVFANLPTQLLSALKFVVTASLCLAIFLQIPTLTVCHICPDTCQCFTNRIQCINQDLRAIPQPLPKDVQYLLVTENNIQNLTGESFPVVLDQLMELYLKKNRIQYIGPNVFANLPNLKVLDLSYNEIEIFSPEAFSLAKILSPVNISVAEGTLNAPQSGALQLTALDLSNNSLQYLPEKLVNSLTSLRQVNLSNNDIFLISDGTFNNTNLQNLDLRNNFLKVIHNDTLTDFKHCSDLQVLLAGNPWHCDCNMEHFVSWLKESDQVLDKQNLSCVLPENKQDVHLMALNITDLQCVFSENMKSILETSYVFLGLVLALIGLMFLLVLYLNRKGIKRWLFNIRDACRDHMEGYHYRYEVSSDSMVTNLGLNWDA